MLREIGDNLHAAQFDALSQFQSVPAGEFAAPHQQHAIFLPVEVLFQQLLPAKTDGEGKQQMKPSREEDDDARIALTLVDEEQKEN